LAVFVSRDCLFVAKDRYEILYMYSTVLYCNVLYWTYSNYTRGEKVRRRQISHYYIIMKHLLGLFMSSHKFFTKKDGVKAMQLKIIARGREWKFAFEKRELLIFFVVIPFFHYIFRSTVRFFWQDTTDLSNNSSMSYWTYKLICAFFFLFDALYNTTLYFEVLYCYILSHTCRSDQFTRNNFGLYSISSTTVWRRSLHNNCTTNKRK